MAYQILGTARPFPGQLRDGRLGTRYEVTFGTDNIDRDMVLVDSLDPELIDKLIKEKIAQHEAIMKLGK